MNTEKLITLADALSFIDDLPWQFALYLPAEGEMWLENAKCMVLDPNETEDPDDDPEIAVKNDLKYVLTISDVQGVVENFKEQKPNNNLNELINAVKYYYENDAFIVLD